MYFRYNGSWAIKALCNITRFVIFLSTFGIVISDKLILMNRTISKNELVIVGIAKSKTVFLPANSRTWPLQIQFERRATIK